jgi:hypothetical protein
MKELLYYKHKNCKDVAIRFLFKSEKGYRVTWINIVNPKNTYYIDTEYVDIKNEDEWEEISI